MWNCFIASQCRDPPVFAPSNFCWDLRRSGEGGALGALAFSKAQKLSRQYLLHCRMPSGPCVDTAAAMGDARVLAALPKCPCLPAVPRQLALVWEVEESSWSPGQPSPVRYWSGWVAFPVFLLQRIVLRCVLHGSLEVQAGGGPGCTQRVSLAPLTSLFHSPHFLISPPPNFLHPTHDSCSVCRGTQTKTSGPLEITKSRFHAKERLLCRSLQVAIPHQFKDF